MNSSAYVFGNLGGLYTQYPEDYAHEIYEKFLILSNAPSQVVVHRDKSIMYYGYVRKLDREGQYIGLCVLLNGVMLSKVSPLFAVFEKVISEMVSQGELIKMDDKGNIVGTVGQLDEKIREVERIVTYLREEVIHWESTATKLPPISYSISNDSYRTFSITDKDEEIVDASAKYGYTCVQKNEGYDTPLLAGLRNVLHTKSRISPPPPPPMSASQGRMQVDSVSVKHLNNRSGEKLLRVLMAAWLIIGSGVAIWWVSTEFYQQANEKQENFSHEEIPHERIIYQYNVNRKNCFIVISKKSLSLKVYEGSNVDTTLVAVFPVCLSKNKGQKYHKGDYKTPECSMENPFRIIQIVDASNWYYDFKDGRGPILAYGHWFLRLNSEFEGIGIMGSTNNEASIPGRESSGSVRLRDNDLDFLKEHYVFEGMKVVIKSEDEGLYDFEKK